jgi:hypothetical protein
MKTQVLITVDTEVYPISPDWRASRLSQDVDRDIYGIVDGRELGLRYQLEMFSRHGLKAEFFVESLFASSKDVDPSILPQIVSLIQGSGQGVQLHVHPDWVPEMGGGIPDRGYLLKNYEEHEQQAIIEIGVENLRRAGASHIEAFRAGDYAADDRTLRCLPRAGIRFDSSYNVPYLGRTCSIQAAGPLFHPRKIGGVWEIPVSCFQDYGQHFRHTQLCACSEAEMFHFLETAHRDRWGVVVIVSHSFEMLANRRSSRPLCPANHSIQRFEGLCEYLDRNRDRFQTSMFQELDLAEASEPAAGPIRGKLHLTALRIVEQGMARLAQRWR